ncbi:signal peptidase I [Corynebacterium mendelii]|uniref:Signal peptidase I n=1 Tax=Corynebacterium mendelii TaxID=2765362 RepID=A0A939DXS8_9CORY|nr:signal peptidase I [Corynebacterium mendelii]MBN9643195.1 signal peptidase I [Corynebacterium mendelii]
MHRKRAGQNDRASVFEHLKKHQHPDADQGKPWYIEIPVVIVLTLLVVGLVQTFIGRLYVIPSESMEPTLHGCADCTGDRIFVNKLIYDFTAPKPGDVVVFRGPASWNEHFVSRRSSNPVIKAVQDAGSYAGLVAPDENNLVKRIVAVGGQTISCQEGDPGIMVDGTQIDSSYILTPPSRPESIDYGSRACGGNYFGPIKVPAGNVYVLGDNRTNSADSRYHLGDRYQGSVPLKDVIGKVQAIVLPLNRIGPVDNPDILHPPEDGN